MTLADNSRGLVRAAVALGLIAVACGCEAPDPPADRQAATAPPTAAAPATAPATKTAIDWTPPRFTDRQADRDAMVRVIQAYGMDDEAVLKVMAQVPRHEFVPQDRRQAAYADSPLPIGHGQTISQPYMVAEMTRQLRLKPTSRVLEIGTGSGYQAAVLAHITPHVYTIEIVKPLAEQAAQQLRRLGYTTVQVRSGDGYRGWPEAAPFDAIIVTAAPEKIPPPLIQQLKSGGRMVIPVGEMAAGQSLMLVEKQPDGKIRTRNLMDVRFVPFTRERPDE